MSMFSAIKRKDNQDGKKDHKPDIFSVCFEATITKVLEQRFEGSKINGCAFLMRQAIWIRCRIYSLPPSSTEIWTSRNWST